MKGIIQGKHAIPYNLNEEEQAMIEALVVSPVYRIIRKIVQSERDHVFGEMVTAENEKAIFRLQGRLNGLALVENIPAIIASVRAQKRSLDAKDMAKKEKESKRA